MVDLALDIALLHEYRSNGDWWYFGFTLTFVFMPAAIISYLNNKYYNEKWKIKCKIEANDEFNLRNKMVIDSEMKFYLRRALSWLLISPLAR